MLSSTQQAILELIVSQVVGTERGNSVSGRFLRAKIKGIALADLAGLQPLYLSSWGDAPNEEYGLTFEGLVASSRGSDVTRALRAILRTWIDYRTDDPDFFVFSWEDVYLEHLKAGGPPEQNTQQERQFFDLVIKLGKLSQTGTMTGNPPVWQWLTPAHIESLMEKAGETGEVDDFIEAIRTNLKKPPPPPDVVPPFGAAEHAETRQDEEQDISIEEAVQRVLKALVGSHRGTADRGTSRQWYTGQQLVSATGLDPLAIDDAVEWLATRNLVKSLGGAGTAPFHFMQVQLRPEGRAFHEKSVRESELAPMPNTPIVKREVGRLRQLLDDLAVSYEMDTSLGDILWRDANDVEAARDAGLHKSVLLLSGSILEAVLVDVLEKRHDLAEPMFKRLRKANANRQFPDDASLPDLLALATGELVAGLAPLLGPAHKPVAQTVIDHRDLIHPHREVRRTQLRINQHSSEALYSFLCVVLHEVAEAIKAGWVRQYEKA